MNNNGEGRSEDLLSLLQAKDIFDDDFECTYSDSQEIFSSATEGKFSVLSQNVRSLGGKFDLLKEYIGQNAKSQITCILLQEVWSIGRQYDLPGYHPLEFNTRDKNSTLNSNCGGGVGIYIDNCLDYEILQFEEEFVEGVYESIWTKINFGGSNSKILGCVYRPNTTKGDIHKAISIHESIIQKLRNDKQFKNADLLIFSDFNADLLNYQNHTATAKYVDFQIGLGLLPLVTKPTRKYHNSATLIDHIFATKTSNTIKVGVLKDSDLSDHFGTAYVEDLQVVKNLNVPFLARKITESSTKKFINLANQVNWDIFEHETNNKVYYQGVLNKIDYLVDEAFPLQLVKPNKVKITPPWFCQGLAESSKRKRKLYAKYRKNPTLANEVLYKDYRSVFQRIHRKAKSDYYTKKFQEYSNNVKETWKIMKTAIGYSKNSKQKFPDYFFEEVQPESQSGAGREGAGGGLGPAHTPPPPPPEPPPVQQQTKKEKMSSKKLIAEGFNKFYSCVGSKLADKIKNQNSTNREDFNHKTFVKKSTNTFHFQEVSSEKILKIVNSLKNKSSSGSDNISNVLLKVISPYLIKTPLRIAK